MIKAAVYDHEIRGIPTDTLGLLSPRTLLFGLSFDSERRIRCGVHLVRVSIALSPRELHRFRPSSTVRHRC